ncbi:MAG: hypothetical protein WA894_01285, partial [Candidatus Acidiferrum sp.]
MRLSSIAGCAFLFFSFGGVIAAQDAQQQPPADAAKPAAPPATAPVPVAPAPAAVAPPEKLILKEGADVSLKFAQDLSSKTATDDDPV